MLTTFNREDSMFRIVLHLPFGLLLVHRRSFYDVGAARTFRYQTYSAFPALEIWKQWEIDAFKGKKINFPFGGENA